MNFPRGLSADEHLRRTGVFKVWLHKGSSALDEYSTTETHETVLRPLLAAATGAWVYDMKAGSEAMASAGDILEAERGKHRIRTDVEPILGHEYFWNAGSSSRGSVVILVPSAASVIREVLPHCFHPGILSNFSVAHSPGAVRFARASVEAGQTIACILSRNNGFDWLFFMAPPDLAETLFAFAEQVCKK